MSVYWDYEEWKKNIETTAYKITCLGFGREMQKKIKANDIC